MDGLIEIHSIHTLLLSFKIAQASLLTCNSELDNLQDWSEDKEPNCKITDNILFFFSIFSPFPSKLLADK